MQITRSSVDTAKGAAEWFTGDVYIDAVAVPVHSGRTTWVWDVRMTDDAGRLCALTRMTVAVRELPGKAAPATPALG